MSAAAHVADHLRAHGVRHAVIGAAALAAHGIARATADLDLLVLDGRVLDGSFWAGLAGVTVDIRPGDPDDPLAGVVELVRGADPVDVVVGRGAWMEGIFDRAAAGPIAGASLPVVAAADLVLLKLYAGGPQDLLDVRLLVAAKPGLGSKVDARIGALPSEARAAWASIVS